MSSHPPFKYDVALIGGAGHIGLPLAMTFADCGLDTVLYDINREVVETIQKGEMPFMEEGGPEMLERVLASGKLRTSCDPKALSSCKFLVCIIGTPVDEHLNPSFTGIHKAIEECAEHLRDGQILILRSTVFPGISRHIQSMLDDMNLNIRVAFCPERVAQGYSLREFRTLPQIISAFDPDTLEEVRELFNGFASEFVEMEPMEAELCKLMTNAWRYLQFAVVNEFYKIATESDVNFDRILHGCRHRYPRMNSMPTPGFAAGPCLVKDTMQLAAFSQQSFMLGHAAMLANEGLPAHVIKLAKRQTDLKDKTVGILGLAFKAENDDSRDSLSYKLRKLLLLEAKNVLATDPYVPDPSALPLERVLEESDVLFVATPHDAYKKLRIPSSKIVIDVWNCIDPQPIPVEIV